MPSNVQIVPLADPKSDNAPLRDQMIAAVSRVIDSGKYILGEEVAAFESALKAQIGTTDAIGVGSGTDALVLALLVLDVGAGDEVITVSHTAGPTVAAIHAVGATPVFVDVTPDTYCINPNFLEEALTLRTKAIIAVHLYGHPALIFAITDFAQRHGIAVIEDCAQAQGATVRGRSVGSVGDVGCFSFYPTKNLGAIGDGGAATTNCGTLAAKLRSLRTYGWSAPQFATLALGRCSRLDELQAAILNVKIGHMAELTRRRIEVAAQYRCGLSGLPLRLPMELPDYTHIYHLFVVTCDRRDELEAYLNRKGIMTGRHYPYPAHLQPGLAANARVVGNLSVTERLAQTILSLPIYGTITNAQVDRVIGSANAFFH